MAHRIMWSGAKRRYVDRQSNGLPLSMAEDQINRLPVGTCGYKHITDADYIMTVSSVAIYRCLNCGNAFRLS